MEQSTKSTPESDFVKVATVISEYTRRPISEITPETRFKELGLDSLDLLSMLLAAEDALGVNSHRDSLAAWRHIQTAQEMMLELISLKGAS